MGSGLQVIDVSNPAAPFIVGSCDIPNGADDVYVSGNHAYVIGSDLHVIDVSDPANPSIIDSCDTPGGAWAVYALGEYAYVADYFSGLQVAINQEATNVLPLTDVIWVNETEITATVPAGFEPGSFNLQVTNPSGPEGILYNAFTVIDSLADPVIDKLRRKRREPGQKFNIVGSNFGWGNPGDYVRIGAQELLYNHNRIIEWTPTNIKVKIPKKKYVKNGCAWFQDLDEKKVKVWVNVGGVDSNKKRMILLKPADCQ